MLDLTKLGITPEFFSDVAGTIPAKIGDPVACMKVEGITFVQHTAAKRPVLREFPDGAMPAFDGIDDVLALARG